MVCLDKTLFLGWDRAEPLKPFLRNCIDLDLQPLVPIEVHYVEKNPGMFSSKNLISFPLKKERHEHLGWHEGPRWFSPRDMEILMRLCGWCPFLAAPVGGVVHQAGPCNVAWVARGGFGQADWSPWALACSAAFGRGPLKNHLLRGHTHRACSLWGDGVLLQARPPDLERLRDRLPQPVEVKAFGFIFEPRLRGIRSLRASACSSHAHLGKSVYNHFLHSSLRRETQTVLDLNIKCQFFDGGLDIYSTPEYE